MILRSFRNIDSSAFEFYSVEEIKCLVKFKCFLEVRIVSFFKKLI